MSIFPCLSPISLVPFLSLSYSQSLSPFLLFPVSIVSLCYQSFSLCLPFLSDHNVLPVTVYFPMFRLHRSASYSQNAVARHRCSCLRQTSTRRRTALHPTLELRKGLSPTMTFQLTCGSHDSTFQSTLNIIASFVSPCSFC